MMTDFDGVEIFSATKQSDRDLLGQRIALWKRRNREAIQVTQVEIRQSSDNAFHCLSIALFFKLTGATEYQPPFRGQS